MCRLLYVRAQREFAVAEHLRPFAELARRSKEYQGHGWGCAVLRGDRFELYHDLRPIWEDELGRLGRTRLLVAHARSAFEDRDIDVRNNMPYHDGRWVFVFNGELRGVRIREQGRIGAEKVFHFIKRFERGDMAEAMRKAVPLLIRRARRVRALNLVVADTERAHLSTSFTEDPDYFTMREKRGDGWLALCSEPYPGEEDWRPIPNGTQRTYP
jgi:glutamine amidotransferase